MALTASDGRHRLMQALKDIADFAAAAAQLQFRDPL